LGSVAKRTITRTEQPACGSAACSLRPLQLLAAQATATAHSAREGRLGRSKLPDGFDIRFGCRRKTVEEAGDEYRSDNMNVD
jgi:hypothetical protein